MYLAYSLLLTFGLVVLIPRFLYQALAHGKYVTGFRERLGFVDSHSNKNRQTIWLHCVSVGETQAARTLVERLKGDFPNHPLVVSTITRTGQQLAREVFQRHAQAVFYFPFDWRWSARRALKEIDPAMVVVMETELWPNFLSECRRRDVPVVLVNGRISRQSFRGYRLIRFFTRRMLSDVRLAVMQSETDATRLAALGIDPAKLCISGNLKFDAPPLPTTTALTEQLRNRFGLSGEVPVILAASTHSPEEEILLQCFRTLKHKPVRLILAPRHPERFQEVASLLQRSGLKWARRTSEPGPSDLETDVILLDTIGELPATYSLASIVFVGGSIVDRGGHNVLEPAAVGKVVVTGAHTHNFDAIVTLLNDADAIVQMPPVENNDAAETLRDTLDDLLTNKSRCKELSERARQLVINNQGATERTVEFLRPLLIRAGEGK